MPNSGAIAPFSTTADLLLGGTATTSADFAFTGVDTNTPVASISAQSGLAPNGLTFNGATSTIQSLNDKTLTIGGTTTGNIILAPGGATALTVQGANLIASGNLTLSTLNSANDILYGTDTTGVVAGESTNSSGLCLVSGASAPSWASCSSGSGGISGTGTTGQIAYFSSSNSLSSSASLYLNSTSGLVGVGTQTPVSTLDVEGAYGSNAALVVDQDNSGDIFDASQGGTLKFEVTNGGSLNVAGGQTIDTITAGSLGIGTTIQNGLTLGRSGAGTTINSSSLTLGQFTTAGGILYTSNTGVVSETAGTRDTMFVGRHDTNMGELWYRGNELLADESGDSRAIKYYK